MANERQLSRQQALDNNADIATNLDNAKEGNRWILANLFTSFELNHIGASPSMFVPDAGKRPTWRDVTIPERSQRLLQMRLSEGKIASDGTGFESSPSPTPRRRFAGPSA
eukprot:GILI01011194.1.p1 GENE.GILI01011194.1~~GILI01011194.1.p1  ORF type:complete len:110 (-),score=5.74 GILI01011194.1:95-424(-)